jgi:hypothetical protein
MRVGGLSFATVSSMRTLYSGAVAFNNMCPAEKVLRSVIRRAPRSEEACDAYGILAHLYLGVGLYRTFRVAMEEKWEDFRMETPLRGVASMLLSFVCLIRRR